VPLDPENSGIRHEMSIDGPHELLRTQFRPAIRATCNLSDRVNSRIRPTREDHLLRSLPKQA